MTTLAGAVRIGPTTNPPLTLGWQILGWTAEYLQQPDGPNASEPWNYTDEQARFVLNWYAIDEHGRFVYRRGMLRRMKGWGKDPLGATLCAIEFVGPCRFGGFDAKGQPVAVPHPAPWVQTAAVSKDQTRNTMTLFPGLFSRRAIDEFKIDMGKEIIYGLGGKARIESVTSSPRAIEGARPTFYLKNETHHWLKNNDGHEMAAVIARNLAKSRDGSARALAISNAHSPGEDSDAEHDYEAYRKIELDGRADTSDFLYDSVEAPVDTDLTDRDALKAGLLAARGDSSWLDVERLCDEIQDPTTEPAMAKRFYLNLITNADRKAFDAEQWRRLERKDHVVPPGALITLGFDGSRNRDWTSLIGTEVSTGFQWPVGIWVPVARLGSEVEIDFATVESTVEATFEQWRVWRMYADPWKWFNELRAWAGRYGEKVIVDWRTNQYSRMAPALKAYKDAQSNAELTHDGDARFAAAIANSYKQEHSFTDDQGNKMWTIEKERGDSPFKIDPAVAGCLSWVARLDAIASGALTPEPELQIF